MPYKVYPFDDEILVDIIHTSSNRTHDYKVISHTNSRELIENKLHLRFLKDYLNFQKSKTILVEEEYIDRYFLEDFSEYYVSCFKRYSRKCHRIHFFSSSFSSNDFKALIVNKDNDISESELTDSYLGFIVIRPLPKYIIGRTCLKPYVANDSMLPPL